MKLRDHPLMSHRSRANWPPVWTQVNQGGKKIVKGEVGVLKYVHANPQFSNKCFLVIEHQAEKYVGCLVVDDLPFCSQITTILRGQLGRAIEEIGDIDVSHTL